MTRPLLLEQMFSPDIATALTARGHHATAVVTDPELRERDDSEILVHALAQGAVLLTNNVVDFEILRRDRTAAGQPVPPLIYTCDTAFPRDRRFIARLIEALDAALRTDAVTAHGGLLWLTPPAD